MPAKYSVRISPSAEADIEDIWSYIAADSPAAAESFILALEKGVDKLEMFPERCPLVPENELLGTRYRHLINGNYRIIFRISGTTVIVLRVIHGARLLEIS